MSREQQGDQEEFAKHEIDPKTGTVERNDKPKKAGQVAENPEDWREQK